MNTDALNEDARAWAQLTDPSQAAGAGKSRYAAAMQLFMRGHLTADCLELYRALANLDAQLHPDHGVHVICALVAGIEAYLERRLPGRFADVRAGITKWKANPVKLSVPRQVDSCKYLVPAVAACADPLAEMVARAAPLLHWITYDAYPRAKIGDAFAEGHAFASVIGEAAPISAKDFDLGLFVIAPNTLYRDHRHKAPELYVPLTGPHAWRFSPGAEFERKPAHSPVWNEPYAPHATLTGQVPFLCFFCWTQDVNEAATVIPAPDWSSYETHHAKG